ncbi:hypothetical protein KCX83_05260 [Brucella oryzae]|uniref:hypothetical protein n=1 Tax=Brucella oryzae TaxID=335286 RepID=UPI001B812785|nr:hypothetical protein [Brucella oryzae]MBR7651730.1 hypothetical protein [Brucella oryzae]
MDKAVKIDLTSDIAGKLTKERRDRRTRLDESGFPVDEQPLPVALKTPEERVTISYTEARPDQTAQQAAKLLVQAGCPVYMRANSLMWLRDVPARDGDSQPINVKRFTDEGMKENLRFELSALANWRRLSDGKNSLTPVPRDLCQMLMEVSWRLGVVPEVDGLFLAPTLRRDGSLLAAEGYDPATRLLLVDLPKMAPLAAAPTREDAEQALALLTGLLAETEFVGAADRAVALSLIISTVVRGALPHVPLHIIKAPGIGSGKSFVVDVANMIATGQRCPAVAARAETDKWERQIAMALHMGDPIVSLDNFNGTLRSDLLAQALTQSRVKALLPYGRNMVEIECKSVLTANGNNISIADDLGRRVVLCQIDARVAEPWKRKFRGDPLGEVAKHRGRYVAAALTMVRAYLAAGEPLRDKLEPLNGFGDWGRFVREPLAWLGEVDPAVTQAAARRDDPNLQKKVAVLNGLEACYGTGEAGAVTLNEMLLTPSKGKQEEWDRLQAALKEAVASKALDAHSLSLYLTKHVGAPDGGLRLCKEANRKGINKWWVERA